MGRVGPTARPARAHVNINTVNATTAVNEKPNMIYECPLLHPPPPRLRSRLHRVSACKWESHQRPASNVHISVLQVRGGEGIIAKLKFGVSCSSHRKGRGRREWGAFDSNPDALFGTPAELRAAALRGPGASAIMADRASDARMAQGVLATHRGKRGGHLVLHFAQVLEFIATSLLVLKSSQHQLCI